MLCTKTCCDLKSQGIRNRSWFEIASEIAAQIWQPQSQGNRNILGQIAGKSQNTQMYSDHIHTMYGPGHTYGRMYGRMYGHMYGRMYGRIYGRMYGHKHGRIYGRMYVRIYGRIYGCIRGRKYCHMYGPVHTWYEYGPNM